jgi:hypothetical protein
MKFPSYTTLITLVASLGFHESSSAASDGPVKVYILAGQSNMVGIGQVTGSSTRWGGEFTEPVLSVYEGSYDPKADYDALEPIKSLPLKSFGGAAPTAFPGGGTQVVRGFFQAKEAGAFQFNPGYGMTIVSTQPRRCSRTSMTPSPTGKAAATRLPAS